MEKYRIISEKIYGDGVSNTVYIKRIYAVPWYMNKDGNTEQRKNHI